MRNGDSQQALQVDNAPVQVQLRPNSGDRRRLIDPCECLDTCGRLLCNLVNDLDPVP